MGVDMKDEKLKMLYDFSLWADALEHIASKNEGNKDILSELDMLSNKSVILSIIEEIENGTYKIGIPTVIKVRKDNGGFRELYVNTIKDRLVLRVLNSIYSYLYSDKIHDLCVSYKRGISVGMVVTKISKILSSSNMKGYKVDISKFFDSVSKEVLLGALDSLSSGSMVDKLILDYYCDDRVFLKDEQVIVDRYKGLAQGCALSSFLCNYILREVDEYFSSSAIYYRYSDDILIFDEDKDILEKLSSRLKSCGLSLNTNKLEKVSSDEWFTFLGFSIKGGMISISRNSLRDFQRNILDRYRSCKSYRGFKLSVYSYLYSSDPYSCRGWFGGKVGTVNCVSDIKCLDMWVQDVFLAYKYKRNRIGSLGYDLKESGVISRGKGRNVENNRIKGVEEEFISMLSLYHLYRQNKKLYLNELIVRGIV